jgi:UDPglucose 6-dehydrogenase
MSLLAYKLPHVEVVVLDISEPRVAAWNSDRLPVYEPGLHEVIKECRGRNLFFSTDARKHLPEADMIFVWWAD